MVTSSSEQFFNFSSMWYTVTPPQYNFPVNDTTTAAVTMVQGQAAPAGLMGLHGQTTATTAGQQLQKDVDSIVNFNRSLSETNDGLLRFSTKFRARNWPRHRRLARMA